MENIGKRIKEAREALGLTQEEFTYRIGVSRAHISKLENDECHPSNALLRFICKEYGIREDWMRYGVGVILEAETQVNAQAVSTTPASTLEAMRQYKAIDIYQDAMEEHRAQEGGYPGISADTATYATFDELLNSLTGRMITMEKRNELADAVSNLLTDEQGIFYRYGVHDAVRFILEAFALGSLMPVGGDSIEKLVSRICGEGAGREKSA